MNTTFKIEKNLPPPRSKAAVNAKGYPFADMKVGDSFFVAGVKIKTIQGSKQWAAGKLNRKFTARTVDGGVRVWRVK